MFSRISNIFIVCIMLIAFGGVLQATAATEELLEIHTLFHGEAVNSHDADAVVSFFAEDGVFDYVPAPPPAEGREAISVFFGAVYQAFPDWQCCPDGPRRNLISGNVIATECYTIGTHGGDWAGVPATGNSVQTIHLDIYDFAGSEIKRLTTYDDNVSILVQMGAMPAPEMPELVPSFTLPEPEPTGLAPLDAYAEQTARWNSTDMVHWAKMIRQDGDFLLGPLGVPMAREAYVAVQNLYLLGMSNRKQENIRVVDLGDGWVLAEIVFVGTNDGPYFGAPATNRPFEVRAGQVSRFDADGLLTYQHTYFDNLTLLTQLGLFPPPR